MKFGTVISAVLGVALLSGGSVSLAADKIEENIIFVVDRSGSMSSMMPNIKKTIGAAVKALPRKHRAGLIHFSGCGEQYIKYDPPLTVRGGRAVVAKLNTLVAGGGTDLAKAINRAVVAAEQLRVCPRLLLFTDNYDTCGGNPRQIMKEYEGRSEELCLEIDIISAAENEETLRQLEELANGFGGGLHRAQTEEEMLEAIRRILARKRQGGGSTWNPSNPEGGEGGGENPGESEEREKEREREREGSGEGESESGSEF